MHYPYIILSFAVLLVITILLAATYPSILLSAYKPVLVLYGKFSKQSGGISVRKFFTVFQFSISSVLIICGIVIDRQMYFFKHADTGVNRQNIVMMPFSSTVGKHYIVLKKDIQSLPGIGQLSVALHPMYKGYDIMEIKPENSNEMVLLPMLYVDQNFISVLRLKWKTTPVDSLFYLDLAMLKNYFKIAIRNVARHKAYAAINITGLAVGIASCLLLFTVVMYELSYEKFQTNNKRIYRVLS